MGKERKVPENMDKLLKDGRKKFVRYEEGAALYSMRLHSFQDLAKDAGAVYRVKRMVLVNTQLINEYLERFRDEY